MSEYRPSPQTQLDDTTTPGFNCGPEALSVTVDKDSLGLLRPDPDTMRRFLAPDVDGTHMAQRLAMLALHYGWSLECPAGDWTPDELWARLSNGAGAQVDLVRSYLGNLGGYAFDGTHSTEWQEAVVSGGVRRVLVYDPLPGRPLWVDWDVAVRAATAFGALVGHPGRIRAAVTRPHRTRPQVTVKGLFFRYAVSGGRITGRSRHRSGGFTAATTAPRAVPWPGNGTRTLVEVTTGAFDGWLVEPRNATVHYIGEED